MIEEELNAVLERVRNWPPERQRRAAGILTLLEERDGNGVQLSGRQLEEVRRRRADAETKPLSLEEFDQRLSRFGLGE
jgi:hypothetical protein